MRYAVSLAAWWIVLGASPYVRAEEPRDRVTTVAVGAGVQPMSAKTDSAGTIHLVGDSPDGPRYLRSTDGGKTLSAPMAVADDESQKGGLEFHISDMIVDKDRRVHVVLGSNAWKLKLPQPQWGCYYTTLDPGASAFAPVRNINRKPSEGFALAADRGRVTAAWLSGKLYANVSHDGGKSFAPTVEIDSSYDPCDCCTTSAVYGADGRLAVLYREETNNARDMYLALWDHDGQKTTRTRVGTRSWKIAACPMTYYSITRAGDGYLAVWPTGSGYEIYWARMDREGRVLPPGEIKTPGRAWHRTGMLGLSAPDGMTLVAWTRDRRLGWQLYDAAGKPLGEPNSVATDGKGVAGVVGENGRFVLFK